MLAAGVVEVMARGKQFDRLGAGTGRQFQLGCVQALVPEQVRRENSQHGQKVSTPAHGESEQDGTAIVSFLNNLL
jgi:hypothetical protein